MYADWVSNAVRFVCGILTSKQDVGGGIRVTPIDAEEYDRLTRKLDRPVPAPIRRFLLEGGARCRIEYWWSIPKVPPPAAISTFGDERANLFSEETIGGAAELCLVEDFADYQNATMGIFDAIGDERTPLHALLETAFPFMCLRNGDFIALDTHQSEEGNVVYLSHERDEPTRLASTFEEFLISWAQLCYIGPDIWELEPYLDPLTRSLNASLPPAEELRKQFRSAMPKLPI